MIDKRREETKEDKNVIVEGANRMDELLFSKITSE
jgi:hypothetical protein